MRNRIKREQFESSYRMFVTGYMTLDKCAKYAGLSEKKIKDLFWKKMNGEEIPDSVFEGKQNE